MSFRAQGRLRKVETLRILATKQHTHSSCSFSQNSQASGRMMPTAFWLTRRTRNMHRPYSQPLLTSVRLLCSSSLRHRREKLNGINKNNCLYIYFFDFLKNRQERMWLTPIYVYYRPLSSYFKKVTLYTPYTSFQVLKENLKHVLTVLQCFQAQKKLHPWASWCHSAASSVTSVSPSLWMSGCPLSWSYYALFHCNESKYQFVFQSSAFIQKTKNSATGIFSNWIYTIIHPPT